MGTVKVCLGGNGAVVLLGVLNWPPAAATALSLASSGLELELPLCSSALMSLMSLKLNEGEGLSSRLAELAPALLDSV